MNISDSVQVLLAGKDRVIERFYDRFLDRHPELKHHFTGRDMRMQASMVTMALVSVEAYYTHRYPATEHYLNVLGHRHYHTGVRPEDFPKFRDVLLEILEDVFQDDWDQQLHEDWKNAIDLAVARMLEGYERTYSV